MAHPRYPRGDSSTRDSLPGRSRSPCFTGQVIVFGIASGLSHDVTDFYASAAEAEAALAQVVAEEPDLEGTLWVEAIELVEMSLN
jgi:hypothetical protein